jgi:hypothetical protein
MRLAAQSEDGDYTPGEREVAARTRERSRFGFKWRAGTGQA